MENLYLKQDLKFYPIINFNYRTGVCEISGESYMEDPFSFYEPVINWLTEYTNEKKTIVFCIKLTYFNTSSSKYILVILDIIKKYKNEGNIAAVSWYYNKEDLDMLKEINEFIIDTGIEINTYTF